MSVQSLISPHERKATGTHYTPRELANFVADQIVAISGDEAMTVLDPACGNGELLRAYHTRCPNANIVGFDLNGEALKEAKQTISTGHFEERDFLEVALNYRNGGLFAPKEQMDVVIANPPYVRTQVMGADRAQEVANAFGLKGRVDLYHAFLEGIAEILRPGGIAGVIVSNRFMTTKAGAIVRERILENFDVIHIWDLGDTKIFEAAVLPAVLLLRRKDGSFSALGRMTTIYTTKEKGQITADSPVDALSQSGHVQIFDQNYHVQHGALNCSEATWRIATEAADNWLNTVKSRTALYFGDIGKIRVGIKTTADKVFVKQHWEEPRPELLQPLLTHKSSRRYRSLAPTHEILYTHTMQNGKKATVNLDNYPISRAYLESHRSVLEERSYVAKAGRSWFEIWVPQIPELWKAPKLVWPDISEQPIFWISLEGELVQGDCYWLTPDSGKEELLWLALAVSNSAFIEEFYDRTCGNKLYSGRRRFMTQYVETFPLPDPEAEISRKIIADVKRLYQIAPSEESDAIAARLNDSIAIAFGVGSKKVTR